MGLTVKSKKKKKWNGDYSVYDADNDNDDNDYDDEKAWGPVQEDEERGARIAGVIIVLLTLFFYNVALLPLWLEFGERLMLIWVSQLREAGNISS